MVSRGKTVKSVKLEFTHDTAGPVFVAGTFNEWDVTATPMKKGRNGSWSATLKLPPGEYEFRYFADGQWFTDFAADGLVPNGFGDLNSLLTVSASRPASGAKAKAAAAQART